MTLDKGHGNYLLGSSDAEHERLIRQARRLAPVTERFFREAGIGPGQRVLDLGAGVGDVAMLLSRLVGPAGEVVAMKKTSICAGLIPSHPLKQERRKPEADSNQQSRSDEEG